MTINFSQFPRNALALRQWVANSIVGKKSVNLHEMPIEILVPDVPEPILVEIGTTAAETTASILAKLDGAANLVGKIGAEYLPPEWYAATVTAAAPGEFLISTVPTSAWWDHVVICAYDVDLPIDASEYEGKKFMLRTEAAISITYAYSNGSRLFVIPAPSVAFGVTHTLIESIGGIWMATLNYSGVPAGGGSSAPPSITPPVSPEDGDLWPDSETGGLAVWYDAESAWVDVSGIGGGSTTYASLTDAATVALPTLNTPLANALAGKAPLESPTFTTPSLGNALATTINGVTISPKSQLTTLNLEEGASFVTNGSVYTAGNLTLGGNFITSGNASVTLVMPNNLGGYNYTFPATSGTLALLSDITGGTVDGTIIDGSANAVSGNAVFDALALKAPSTGIAPAAITGTAIVNADARLTDERVPTAAGLTTQFSTADATVVDADRMAIFDSTASFVPKHALLSTLWTWIKAKIDAGQTWAGAQTFSGGLTTTTITASGTVTASPLEVVAASFNNKFRILNNTTVANAGVVEFSFLNSGSGTNNFAFRGANCRLSVENSNDGATATGSFISSFATFQLGMGGYNVFGMTLAGKVGSLVPSLGSSPTWRNVLDDGSGNMTIVGRVISTPGARSGPGAVPVTVAAVALTTTGVADAITLANGTNGQILTISHVSRGGGTGTAVLTPATANGYTTITFTASGDGVTLQYHTTGGWHIVGSRGVTIA